LAPPLTEHNIIRFPVVESGHRDSTLWLYSGACIFLVKIRCNERVTYGWCFHPQCL
jgi:hypothetical protein